MRPCTVIILQALLSAAAARADWPQFRGPTGDGISPETGLPLTWSETENVAWKTPISGLGRSSPVVLGERVWVTTAVKEPGGAGESARAVAGPKPAGERISLEALCLERASGKVLYRAAIFSIEKPMPIHDLNSHATPTPVAEPERLYCDFGAYGTACLDASSGKVLWRERLPVDHHIGPGSSPAVCGEWLILVRDGCDAQYVAALDKRTGRRVWRTDRPPFPIPVDDPVLKKSFSSPLVISAGGAPQVVVAGPQWIVAYEPATGKEVWRAHHGKGYSIAPSPVYGHGKVYFCTGDWVAQLWAVRAVGRGDVTSTGVAWKATSQIPLMASPLLVGEELYIVSDLGVVSCLDASTGELLWRERIGGNFSASPIHAEGRIYFFGREGKTTVLRPGRELARLAESQLDGTVIASPAVSGGAIFLRTDTHLYCLKKVERS